MGIDPTIIENVCNRLAERNVALFLGAGINYGLQNDNGLDFPLGQELSNMICKDILDDSGLEEIPLDEASEMAQYKLGVEAFNEYLYNLFTSFRPGTAHLSLLQIPWDVIYTTNYDDLLEQAASMPLTNLAGSVKPIFSLETSLKEYTENDLLYYKLHGCMKYANTPNGKLILTKEDYRFYRANRKPLFKRLKNDLQNKTFIFVGYSLRDSNFRNILDDCREEVGWDVLPLSYSIKKEFSKNEEAFWRDKYNIQLIKSDGLDFLHELCGTWKSQCYEVVPFEVRESANYISIDETARLQKIAESFYQLNPSGCIGNSNTKRFYKGAEPTWADIRDGIAPKRDVYWPILDALLPELTNISLPPKIYLLTGAAGTGKTTLIHTLAYDIVKDSGNIVLLHIPSTPIEARSLRQIINMNNDKRIIVVIHHASDYIKEIDRLYFEVVRDKLPVTIILEDRKNQWNFSISNTRNSIEPIEFELGTLTENEIRDILVYLDKYNLLGKLSGSGVEEQVAHFTALAHKELLVALRELTSENAFDSIVLNEFDNIPSDVGKSAYTYVSALGQFDLAIRYESLIRILGISHSRLVDELFKPTEGVLLSAEAIGQSRHNAGYRLIARHPIIASIVFDKAAYNDELKYKIINDILSLMDPGYQEDKKILLDLVRKKDLVNTLTSRDMRRGVYERLEDILPNNPYVLQHRSILEKELNDPEQCLAYARKAVNMDDTKKNPVLLNTLGIALEFSSRFLKEEPLIKSGRIAEAKRIFEEGISNKPADPYSYLGLVFIYRQELAEAKDEDRKLFLKYSIISLLEDAFEATGESSIIATELANEKGKLDDLNYAIAILEDGLIKDPNENRLRDLLIRLKLQKGEAEPALKLALEGEKHAPTSWRIQRHLARIKKTLHYPAQGVIGHYEAAIRHHKGDVFLLVELGAYLYINNHYSKAKTVFNTARNLPISSEEKKRIRQMWVDEKGESIIFNGEVESIAGATASALTVPQNNSIFFWRTTTNTSSLREKDKIQFNIGFNAHGPIAKNIRKLSE